MRTSAGQAVPRSWDIFCTVVDNYGDIGVCWRLARQLAAEQGAAVRLWVDDLQSFRKLCPEVDPALALQVVRGVQVCHWTSALEPGASLQPAEAVVEGFGCRLPGPFLAAMAARTPQPAWINLEYLSAEDWVDSHHGLASPHPQLPLVKYFFFPGFTGRTGGLLTERGLAQRREAFQGDVAAQAAFRASIGIAAAEPGRLVVSLFCYDNADWSGLIDTWSAGPAAIECLVPEGAVAQAIAARMGAVPGRVWQHGALRLQVVPFLDQDGYDRLLWSSDLNFVRGEDSFVRAQHAGRPMVWQAYPQDEAGHLLKMEAFLDRYCDGTDDSLALPVRQFWQAWNRAEGGNPDWAALWHRLQAASPAWRVAAASWALRLSGSTGLADNLALFCQNKLK